MRCRTNSVLVRSLKEHWKKKKNSAILFHWLQASPGFCRNRKSAEAEKPGLIEQLKVGDSIAVTVEEIHPRDRKITLAPGDAKDEGAWKNFAQAETPLPKSDLAEKLRQAMVSKNNK